MPSAATASPGPLEDSAGLGGWLAAVGHVPEAESKREQGQAGRQGQREQPDGRVACRTTARAGGKADDRRPGAGRATPGPGRRRAVASQQDLPPPNVKRVRLLVMWATNRPPSPPGS